MAEVLHIEFHDRTGAILASSRFSDGFPDRVTPPLRQIVSTALATDAAAVTLAHNHPSGIAQPSAADHAFTRRLVDILHPLGIRVHDHVIVAGGERYSFRAEGLL